MNSLVSRLRTLVIAASAGWLLAFSSASSAAAFQVNFDPPFELWGSAIFNVQDSCLANDGNFNFWQILQLGTNDGCYITFGGASISVTGENGPFTSYGTTVPFDLVVAFQMIVQDHDLAGITTLVPLELATAPTFALQTSSLGSHHCSEAILFTAAGSVTFFGCQDGQPFSLPGDVTSIVRIPEPGTLALLFGAGIAGWWVRRRRAAA